MAMRMAVRRPLHPALVKQAEERARDVQNRIADLITRFAGSMPFVYIHAVFFAVWIVSRIEAFPHALPTMIVSLEAIFLSTSVVISQNLPDDKPQALAVPLWKLRHVEQEQDHDP